MNGCHNRADYKPSYWVQDGYYDSEPGMPPTRLPRMVEVPFRMSQDCRYTHDPLVGQHDEGCMGCKHHWNGVTA